VILVLASNSPRRRKLLSLAGWTFSVLPVEVDENPRQGESGAKYVLRLAESKARASAAHIAGQAVVIAADTCVVDGKDLLGKPVDGLEAETILRRLRGRVHQVYSALAVLRMPDETLLTDLCITDVPMRDYSDQEMIKYISSGDPLDKAGAYAIQHSGFHPVEGIQGCYANVMGLPLCHLLRTLRRLGISPQVDLPAACQSELDYRCPVFHQVLDSAQ
jgi:MAF protein